MGTMTITPWRAAVLGFSMPGLGEWILILVVLLIVFGPRRLPEIGRALRRAIDEFRRGDDGGAGDRQRKDERGGGTQPGPGA